MLFDHSLFDKMDFYLRIRDSEPPPHFVYSVPNVMIKSGQTAICTILSIQVI